MLRSQSPIMSKDKNKYQATLNLPKTDFPMRANLKEKEIALLAQWESQQLYTQISAKESRDKYILHDGPPYANGHIHIGHALNKILKDFVIKSKTMEGFSAPYIPGWDCHGLPIEHQVLKDLGPKRAEMSKLEIRKRCREYAQKFIAIQKEEFKRLGVLGDWENPYLTLTPDYEAAIVREFGKVVESGAVYKGLKPVLWCAHDETALAEAEVEYQDKTSPSIYVKFQVVDDPHLSFMIWTTTPWTLVANQAVCLHPDFDYQYVSFQNKEGLKETSIMAKERVPICMEKFGIQEYQIEKTYKGSELEGVRYVSPFSSQEAPVILGRHVTLDQGTGCVHTAPGHGMDDYIVGREYGLPTFAPVDHKGRFTTLEWKGLFIFKANEAIINRLAENGTLVREDKITHSYPHCWRCKNPVFFRATEQWFVSMEKTDLRKRALAEIEQVQWIPKWGKDRIIGAVSNRPDWCLSRQRDWGVPIVAFACVGCKELLLSKAIIDHIATLMKDEGADIWFSKSAKELLPEGTACKCGSSDFLKENDILDVWFESGVSHAAVLKARNLSWPADLYLEGSDQHRGWFQSSLLAALETDHRAPYKAVLTHGFTVDGEGKKMSKSVGNVVAPQEVTDRYGAEILRLWVAATDFRDDVRISESILQQLVEAYRKIRNTCRFLLSNLYDYIPSAIPEGDLLDMDRWALYQLDLLHQKVRRAYEQMEFHIVFHSLNQFCAVDLSAFYLDILKDRLYAEAADDPSRRAAQSVLHEILLTLIKLMTPILSFTAEELWQTLPAALRDDVASVHLAEFPKIQDRYETEALRWDQLRTVREEVLPVLEKARQDKKIGASLEAQITLRVGSNRYSLLKQNEPFLPTLFIVSKVTLEPANFEDHFEVIVSSAAGAKCERCWIFREVGIDPVHPTLCQRCVEVVTHA